MSTKSTQGLNRRFFQDLTGDPPLFEAARMNNYSAVELIIRYSKTVPNPFSSNNDILKWKSKCDETALYIAVKEGYIDIVDLLMSKGACAVEPCLRGA